MKRWMPALVIVVIGWAAFFALWGWAKGGGWWNPNTVHGSGHVVAQARAIAGVRALEVAGPWDVVITQGDRESLRVRADDNLLPLLDTSVSDGWLRLGTKRLVSIDPSARLQAALAVKDLSEIHAVGSAVVQCDHLKTAALTTDVSGSGSITYTAETKRLTASCTGSGHQALSAAPDEVQFDVHGSGGIDAALWTRKLECEVTGSGEIIVQGSADTQDISVTGSGRYRGEAMKSRAATVSVTGSGDANVGEAEELEASVTGSGCVRYAGQRTRVTQHVQGSGEVVRTR